MKYVVQKIAEAKSILLSTHRQCDGDGLGAQLALFHALKKAGKNVRILNVDGTPKKYSFLQPEKHLSYFQGPHEPVAVTDLCLIFDTNDRRLVEPLYSNLETKCAQILFIDHHPILHKGPEPTPGSIIDIEAASTGEVTYQIIQDLKIELDADIARALYTSIVFDTQLFRFIRGRAHSHQIATHLLEYEKNPEEVHRFLFGNQTVGKLRFLAKALGEIEFLRDNQLALLKIALVDLDRFSLDFDDARDIIDTIMNIEELEAAVMFREDGPRDYKVSLRSKGQIEVLGVAEAIGGGGHRFAAGAFVQDEYENLRRTVIEALSSEFEKHPGLKKTNKKT